MSTGQGVVERGRGKKGGENVVPVVERGREGGVLEARREKGRWRKRGGGKRLGSWSVLAWDPEQDIL